MPPIIINQELGPPYKDMIILHDGCSYLVHSYIKILKDQGVEEPNIVVPKNLAQALV